MFRCMCLDEEPRVRGCYGYATFCASLCKYVNDAYFRHISRYAESLSPQGLNNTSEDSSALPSRCLRCDNQSPWHSFEGGWLSWPRPRFRALITRGNILP